MDEVDFNVVGKEDTLVKERNDEHAQRDTKVKSEDRHNIRGLETKVLKYNLRTRGNKEQGTRM